VKCIDARGGEGAALLLERLAPDLEVPLSDRRKVLARRPDVADDEARIRGAREAGGRAVGLVTAVCKTEGGKAHGARAERIRVN
jgi:hypothetical protein